MERKIVRLSPIVRLRQTFNIELNLDKGSVLGLETYEKYLEMQRSIDQRQDQLIRGLFIMDAALFLIMSGQNWSVPGFGVELSSIPAIQEILLFSTALSFFFLCGYFVTNQCYIAIIDQYGNRIVNSDLVDPDFFNASRKHFDFFLKLFRPKLNFWGIDFYQHGRAFAIFSWIITTITILVVLTLPAAHLLLTWAATAHMLESEFSPLGKYFLTGAVSLVNLAAVLMVFGAFKDFNFSIAGEVPEGETEPSGTLPKPDE